MLCGLDQQCDNTTTELNEISYRVEPSFEYLCPEIKWKKIGLKIIYRMLEEPFLILEQIVKYLLTEHYFHYVFTMSNVSVKQIHKNTFIMSRSDF